MSIWVLQVLKDFAVTHILLSSVIVGIIVLYVFKQFGSRKLRLPPRGPRGLPLLGFLPFQEADFHLQLTKMRQTYGDIFSMYLGCRYVVVLNRFKDIKEANNKDDFSGRPPGLFKISDTVRHMGDMDLKDWKETRRFSLMSLRTLGMGKNNVEEMIQTQISSVISSLASCTGKSEVNLHSHLFEAITNTIIYLICGRTVSMSPTFNAIVDTFSKNFLDYLNTTSNLYFLPFLKPISGILYPKLKELQQEMDNMEQVMRKEIEAHEKDLDESDLSDYMDFFLFEMKKRLNDPSTFTQSTLIGNSQLLLMAGSDTIRTTVEWTMLYMVKYPEVQERAYKEIVEVLGKERPASWNDRENLPYLEAVIMETSRMATIVPLGDPHWTEVDTTVGNYDIPKGTYILNNLHAVHMDSNLWDNPQAFKPERFLTDNGRKCKAPEYLIPFAYGKRICPGEKLANVSVFLFVTSLLQHFRMLPPSSGLNMEGEITLVIYPKNPFVRVQRRE